MESKERQESIRGLDYPNLGFFLLPPYRNNGMKGPYRIRGRDEHKSLLAYAKKIGYYLYYSTVEIRNGKTVLTGPDIVDFESVPDDGAPTPNDGKLRCPHCKKVVTSASGLTLHLRAKHRK